MRRNKGKKCNIIQLDVSTRSRHFYYSFACADKLLHICNTTQNTLEYFNWFAANYNPIGCAIHSQLNHHLSTTVYFMY